MADLKALTVVNLPYLEERFQPGQMIPREKFDAYLEAAKEAFPDLEVPDSEDVIDEMIANGSLSEDPDAELHPNHRPVPISTAGTVTGLVAQARSLVAALEDADADVPEELQSLAEMDAEEVNAADAGLAGDES